ncbi:MAG: FecR domain-containing protein, partial [Parvularcula sp.]|nr:FecR domain-containing protein [Parvularcula sp.]
HQERFLALAKTHLAAEKTIGSFDEEDGLGVSGAVSLLLERRPALASGIAASLVLAVAAAIVAVRPSTLTDPEIVRTAIGQQLEHRLEDGSALVLNTHTDLAIDYTRRERRVVLTEGEALFEVVRDASRPFVVVAGEHEIRVLGTTFSVRFEGGEVEVLVEEGLVRLEPRGEEPILLSPKQRARVGEGERSVVPVQEAELLRELSWRGGSLVFSETPLREVIDEVSRYTDMSITISDPALEALTIDGYFRVGETEALLEALSLGFGIDVVTVAPGRVELHRTV